MRTGPGLGEPQGVSPQDEPAASDARAEGEWGWGGGSRACGPRGKEANGWWGPEISPSGRSGHQLHRFLPRSLAASNMTSGTFFPARDCPQTTRSRLREQRMMPDGLRSSRLGLGA